jgi:tetratricopeptide (TPR) repeat protein
MKKRLVCLSLAALACAVAQPKGDNCAPPPSALAPTLPAKLLPGMGTVHLTITTSNPEAQKFFDQGLAQMHSFWAREAERSFAQAAALDPKAPMPQWGIAMVAAGDWRPRFQLDLLEAVNGRRPQPAMSRARAAAEKAVELSGNATDLEKLYIAAIAARRDAAAKEPEEAFVKGMRALLAKYPDEVEARLDLALMVMRGFSLPDKKPKGPGSMEAVEILRGLLSKAPEHAGVHHYVIHGFEGATFAKDAWPSCDKYAALVPNIPHALHMPGHIYSQTGRWEDAVKAFDSAAKSEREYMKADRQYGDGHHGHNLHYLATASSFNGRYDDAVGAAKELLAFKENPAQAAAPDTPTTARAQGWFAMLRTLVQFSKWDEILAGELLPEYGKPRQESWRRYARALAQANKGNVAAARAEAAAFEEALADFQKRTTRPEPPELQVARREMAGHIEAAEGRIGRAVKTLRSASKAERKLTYTEPPYYPRPVAEALGQLASRNNKEKVARKAFAEALEQYPGDAHAKEPAPTVARLGR